MRWSPERSAGIIPYRVGPDSGRRYLLIYSARVRDPRARWEFPKGGIEPGECPREAAAREFAEETGIASWRFRDGFERSVCYTYARAGLRRSKTVTYFVAEVLDDATLARSPEHAEGPDGRWYVWGSAPLIRSRLRHARMRALFDAADAWLGAGAPAGEAPGRRRLVASAGGPIGVPASRSPGAIPWEER